MHQLQNPFICVGAGFLVPAADLPSVRRTQLRSVWGRHDIFFHLQETLSWMKALPRMEAHILDGPHFLLETHPDECAALMSAFVRRAEGLR